MRGGLSLVLALLGLVLVVVKHVLNLVNELLEERHDQDCLVLAMAAARLCCVKNKSGSAVGERQAVELLADLMVVVAGEKTDKLAQVVLLGRDGRNECQIPLDRLRRGGS